jgi:hypothetical protein
MPMIFIAILLSSSREQAIARHASVATAYNRAHHNMIEIATSSMTLFPPPKSSLTLKVRTSGERTHYAEIDYRRCSSAFS